MKTSDFKKIEKRWQSKWEKAKIFESEPSKKNKFFTSFVIPYPSGDLHIGHARTFSRTDVMARFKRLQGFNTLAPVGFHATGNRAIVMTKRIREKDKKTLDTLKNLYKLKQSEIKQLENPEKFVLFFKDRGTETLKQGGFSIDWRRQFVSTTANPHFCKFIEWQFRTLKKKGYVVKGSHPVIYCPACESPITQADRDLGEDAIVQTFTVCKCKIDNSDLILPAATLRPDTVFAWTNMFLNPDAEYVIADVDGERWILGKEAAKKIKPQRKSFIIIDDILPEELIGKTFSNPITGEKGLLILPGDFVDASHSTGVVVSEPSDAPDDHIALEDLKKNEAYLKRYNLSKQDIENIKYKPLVDMPGYGKFPAIEICERMGIKSGEDKEKLLAAKKELYKAEFHTAKLAKIAGKLKGLTIPKAIEAVKEKYAKELDSLYAPSERVTCKCGSECHVKLLENQWFLKYGDKAWKERVRKHMKSMNIYPKTFRAKFEAGLDWTENKACARKSGLGTPLPWDKEWIIETLSDSTIYMAFYIITKFIKPNKIKPAQLTDSLFDYVFLNKGDIKKVAKATKLSSKVLKEMQKDFFYWYPVDWRNSGEDLVTNHLLYFVYNHVAIFPKKFWPKTISVNKFVNLASGERMSKSRGTAVTFGTAIKEYGADVVRAASTTMAAPDQYVFWQSEFAENLVRWRKNFYELVLKLSKSKITSETNLDNWLASRTMQNIELATESLEKLVTREASQAILYSINSDIKWYLRKNGNKISKTAKKIINEWVKMVSLFMPHVCEELWSKLGNKGFVSTSEWPKVDKKKIDKKAEQAEEAIKKAVDDIRHVQKLVKGKPKKCYIYVIPPELKIYKESETFFTKELQLKTQVFALNDTKKYDPQNKSKKAKPGRPAIFLE